MPVGLVQGQRYIYICCALLIFDDQPRPYTHFQAIPLVEHRSQLFTMRFEVAAVLAAASTAIASPISNRLAGIHEIANAVLVPRQTGTTATELESGACKRIIFIYARGSTEPGNLVRRTTTSIHDHITNPSPGRQRRTSSLRRPQEPLRRRQRSLPGRRRTLHRQPPR